MRCLIGLLCALLVGCVELNQPVVLARDDVRGTWVFTASAAGCAASPIRVVVANASSFGDAFVLEGTWEDSSAPQAPFSTGEVDRLTGSFLFVRSATGPRVTLTGTMRADGTASGQYTNPACQAQPMNGQRQ